MFEQTLQRLREGNQRYVSNQSTRDISKRRRSEVAQEQKPFAAILGCVDSRVPPEIIFDQGLGDLFVIRSAGQVLDQAVLGSLELGVAEFHIPVIVVLGHKRCGAVKLALEVSEHGSSAEAEIAHLVKMLEPAIQKAKHAGGDIWNNTARKHIEMVANQLKRSPILDTAVQTGALKIVCGWYDLDTGVVEIANG